MKEIKKITKKTSKKGANKMPVIHLKSGSPLGEGLKKMVEHKRLRERFWLGEISMDELNQLLKEKGINKQYERTFAL